MRIKLSGYSVAKMSECGIPDRMHASIIRYIEQGIRPGHFLTAVINNDLFEAVSRAGSENKLCLDAYVIWFCNYAPGGCSGRAGAVDEWIQKNGEDREHDNED